MRQPLLLPLDLLTGMLVVVGASGLQPGSTLHSIAGRLFIVAMIPGLPLCVVLPLASRWGSIRRKRLAVAAFIVPVLIIGLSILSESFTGYFIPRMEVPEQHPGTLLRMKVLHRLTFPILLILGLAALWIISIRLARRRPSPER